MNFFAHVCSPYAQILRDKVSGSESAATNSMFAMLQQQQAQMFQMQKDQMAYVFYPLVFAPLRLIFRPLVRHLNLFFPVLRSAHISSRALIRYHPRNPLHCRSHANYRHSFFMTQTLSTMQQAAKSGGGGGGGGGLGATLGGTMGGTGSAAAMAMAAADMGDERKMTLEELKRPPRNLTQVCLRIISWRVNTIGLVAFDCFAENTISVLFFAICPLPQII
jgi:hypothetical protein